MYRIWRSVSKKMEATLTQILELMEKKMKNLNEYNGPLIFMCSHYQNYDHQLLLQIKRQAKDSTIEN